MKRRDGQAPPPDVAINAWPEPAPAHAQTAAAPAQLAHGSTSPAAHAGLSNADSMAAASNTAAAADDTLAAAATDPDDLLQLPTVDTSLYCLGEEVARGAMGRIVRARDRRLGRQIAIKELLAPSPALERRFEREMRITARLQHPAIICVHEAGRWPSGVAFYAMKYVDGAPLDEVIAHTTSLSERLALLPHVIAVADALAYAHDRGVVHRDLKPANVLVGDFGETVVIDWGLAKALGQNEDEDEDEDEGEVEALAQDTNLTILGQAMGTPAYMPPEQARGDVVDQRADVYALGALLYHLLGGQPPYSGASSAEEILDKVKGGPPKGLVEIEPAT